jgi:predicted HD superfamily hydrolase involved in NAD metabolism
MITNYTQRKDKQVLEIKTGKIEKYNFYKIEEWIKKRLSEERYIHSHKVSLVAEKIAGHYSVSTEKAKFLGLVHDCAKDYTYNELGDLIGKYNINLSDVEKDIPALWHGYVAAAIIKESFFINDEEMLDAIRYHSTAYRGFGILGKIIYIADKIEPDREIKKVEEIRELVWKDIDSALLVLLNQEIKSLIDRNLLIHPETLFARNKAIIEQKVKRNNIANE